MTRLIHAEMLKLRGARPVMWTIFGVLGLSALIAGATSASVPAADTDELKIVLTVSCLVFPAMAALFLGLLAMTGEYQHHTILPTLLITPRRNRLLTAKLVTAGCLGAVLGLLSSAVTLMLAVPVTAARDIAPFTGTELALVTATAAVSCLLFACLGVALGGCFRASVPAIIAVVAWASVGEQIVAALLPASTLPFGALAGLARIDSTMPAWASAASLVTYIAVAYGLARHKFLPRDITVG